MTTSDEPIGRGSATEREANSADKFRFWIKPEELVNPFDIVSADHYPAAGGKEDALMMALML